MPTTTYATSSDEDNDDLPCNFKLPLIEVTKRNQAKTSTTSNDQVTPVSKNTTNDSRISLKGITNANSTAQPETPNVHKLTVKF